MGIARIAEQTIEETVRPGSHQSGADSARRRVLPRPRLSGGLATRIVIALWFPYLALNTFYPGPTLTYALGFLLAVAALSVLSLAGIAPRRCYLQLLRLSRPGLLILVALCVFIPGAAVAGRVQQHNWALAALIAIASAAGQELYFRSALLIAIEWLRPAAPFRVVLLQAILFALWHARAFRVVPPAPAIGVLVLTFAAGLAWGWQVRNDRTIAYAALQHALFLFIQ